MTDKKPLREVSSAVRIAVQNIVIAKKAAVLFRDHDWFDRAAFKSHGLEAIIERESKISGISVEHLKRVLGDGTGQID